MKQPVELIKNRDSIHKLFGTLLSPDMPQLSLTSIDQAFKEMNIPDMRNLPACGYVNHQI